MYLSITLVLLIIDTLILTKKANTSYILSVLIMILVMAVFTGEMITFYSLIMTLLIVLIFTLFKKIRDIKSKVKKDNQISKNLNFGFYLAVSNITMLIYVIYALKK